MEDALQWMEGFWKELGGGRGYFVNGVHPYNFSFNC